MLKTKNNKVYKDNMVAVLYSPGFGAGWSTWNTKFDCVFTPEVVMWVLDGSKPEDKPFVHDLYKDDEHMFYAGGMNDLKVMWVPKGSKFMITEYDGSESVQFLAKMEYHQA